MYCRYVDDIFLSMENFKALETIKNKLEEKSVLKVSYEIEVNKQLSFLDSLVKREENHLQTAVYIKNTNTGDIMNYNSICPQKYKIGVNKTLLNRAYVISTNWKILQQEISRFRQLFVNNNFTMSIIDDTVKTLVNEKIKKMNLTIEPNKDKITTYDQINSVLPNVSIALIPPASPSALSPKSTT